MERSKRGKSKRKQQQGRGSGRGSSFFDQKEPGLKSQQSLSANPNLYTDQQFQEQGGAYCLELSTSAAELVNRTPVLRHRGWETVSQKNAAESSLYNILLSSPPLPVRCNTVSEEIHIGPPRPFEDPSPVSIPDETEDEDFLTTFRRLHPNMGRGRGRGLSCNLLPNAPVETTTEMADQNKHLTSEPNLLSSSTSTSQVGTEDYSEHERAIVEMRGKNGEKLRLSPNFIRLRNTRSMGMYEYHVEFEPILESFKFKKVVLRSIEAVIGKTRTFDGSKLYLPLKLENNISEISAPHPSDVTEKVTVIIKFVKQSELRDCVHFYNILFRRIMEILGWIEMHRHFYDYRTLYDLPEHKLEIWPGYVTAVNEYEGGLMICCEASFRVLRTTTILDVLSSMKATMGQSEYRAKFQDYILGKIVLTRYNNKCYRIDDIAWGESPRSTFPYRGTEITYTKYYEVQYNVLIRDLDQPLLIHRPPERANTLHDPIRLICLIPELCFVSGLTEDITSNHKIMRDIAQFTKISPQQRHTALKKFVENIKGCDEAREILESWGLQIEDSAVVLDGRVIKPPIVALNDGFEFKPKDADFTREATSNPCFDPVTIRSWLIVCTNRDQEVARRMVKMYKIVAQPLGIHYGADAQIVNVGRGTVEDFRSSIAANLKPHVQFVVAILPGQREDLYAAIKKLCCVDSPIPSQVVLVKTINNERKFRAIMQKIALQINCKLGGALWTIRIPLPDKIMFVGIDVYHDPKRKMKSVTALVASMNLTHTKYYSRVIFQRTHQETVNSLRPIFADTLSNFYEENHCWPDRIVVFRDGVGDGQLNLTKELEVVQMTSACEYMCENNPKFSFTVVQKRINSRLFQQSGAHYTNPPPGTVLDHTITRPHLFDFFLVSQLVREGTVSPSHYIVLADNGGISPDMIQKFAYATSFMYFNWAGSVRVPAMCQYAHKLASLAGQYIKTEPSSRLSKSLFYL